jgi:ABC-type multidrug transport system fused ATPase/permease subunit
VTNQVIDGIMTPGDFSVLYGLTLSIGGSGLQIGTLWINMQTNVAAVRRVFFFVDLESEDERKALDDLTEVRTAVRFDHVDFNDPNGHAALSDINLELQIGELIAIVGPTGAGKTSLAHLIPGFYRPTSGRVLFDGRDIATVNVDSLRSQVSYVFQEHLLMSESIRSNLLLANPKASADDMLEACRSAGAMEFIDALPGGLDALLGQSGDTLSVGQKQRLCIARGLVRNTRILILDEPTAALDPATENALMQTLRQAAEGRLVVVIAHRLSTIRQADRIIFLEDGQIMDIGNHDSLMADPDSRYRRFVELQGGK